MNKTSKKLLALVLSVGGVGGAFILGAAIIITTHFATPVPLTTVTIPQGALAAKAAIIYDPQSGRVLYQKDSNQPLPLASLTKLMTADVVLSQKEPQTPVTITDDDLKLSDAGDVGFQAGQTAARSALVQFGLITSSNDAMSAAAGSIGDDYLDKMNQQAAALGLTEMHFLNPTGLDESSTVAGAYGSAYDIARLTADFYQTYPSYFENTSQATGTLTLSDGDLSSDATAAPLFNIPGLIGAKTGYTDLAGGNLVAAFDVSIGHPLIAAVLGSTENGRYTDIETLIAAARAQLQP
jgi:D-alanyl-D-alanine carboxypeptidase (penicillin-binding protein 5/6)